MARYPLLLSPFELAGQRLRNRIVHAAMNTHMAHGMRVTDQLIHYHAARARGGAAMIVTEPISMAPHQKVSYRARAWNDDNLDGLKRWAETVESEDCRLLGQIQDPGRGRHNTGIGADAIGASPLPDDLSWLVPRALAVEEIHGMIEAFASSAARLKRCWSTCPSSGATAVPSRISPFLRIPRRAYRTMRSPRRYAQPASM